MMKKYIYILLVLLLKITNLQAQVVLQALEGQGEVSPPVLPPGVIIHDTARFFASIYDDDYLPYTTPTTPAAFGSLAAGGGKERLIDYQGKISTTGVFVFIPITVSGGNVNLPAYTSDDLLISADKTENNQEGALVLSWNAQELTPSRRYFFASLKSKGQELQIKKLDINKGVGVDNLGVLLGSFTLPQSNGNTLAKLDIRVIAGIPDRNFEKITNGELEHQFLYLPIQGPDGKTWLNHNLGAEYANVNSLLFNSAQQIQQRMTVDEIKNDGLTYGSLFLWGRAADGHELIDWGRGHKVKHQDLRWGIDERNITDWPEQDNPCPEGYHVPSLQELIGLHRSVTGEDEESNSSKMWNESLLRLPPAGTFETFIRREGIVGAYWSSYSFNPFHTSSLIFGRDFSEVIRIRRIAARCVRCIRDY